LRASIADTAASESMRLIDVGSGSGAGGIFAASLLGKRAELLLADINRKALTFSAVNAILNDLPLANQIFSDVLAGIEGEADIIMANPPYLDATSGTPPPDGGKAVAHVEGEADLAAWVKFALTMVRAKGSVTFIHRADRLDRLLAELCGRAGAIEFFPLWAGEGKPAKRVILRARKGVATPMRVLPGLVLHEADGRYTAAADAVLRDAAALVL